MDGSSKKNENLIVHKVYRSSKKDGNFIKSIKWTVHPRRMKTLSKVHKVDGSSKKDENLMKSIKWTIHPRRMKI